MTQEHATPETLSPVLREISADCAADLAKISALHIELLSFGPIAGLGERFIREVGYGVHMRDGTLRVALCEVQGEPAGFIAYTDRSVGFHRKSLRDHFIRAGWIVFVSILRDPSVLLRLIPALRVVASRRSEQRVYSDPLGEIVSIAVRPKFLDPPIADQLDCRLSEELIVHAARSLAAMGVKTMRGLVDADNKAPLFLYKFIGARLERYEQGGEPQMQFWFDDLPAFLAERSPATAKADSPAGQ